MNTFLEKIADVLDALAQDADARPAPPAVPDSVLSAFETRTGKTLTASARAKIAADPEIRSAVESFLSTPETPRAMGSPAEKIANSAAATPTSSSAADKAARLAAANNAFVRTVMNSHNND